VDLGLTGARALVLASSSGLGRAVAASLVSEGARVAVTSRDASRSEAAASEVGAELALAGDLSLPGQPTRLVEAAVAAWGGLDVCVVNTGGGAPGGILDTSGADAAAGFASMLRPALEVSRAAAPHLAGSGHGRLVFLVARSVVEATPELALSGVMRSGVAAAARSLALELAPSVLVNVVVVGQFDTPALHRAVAARAAASGVLEEQDLEQQVARIPLRRLGFAHELADVVTFLCSRRASFVTGSVVRVDGGAVRGF
jgi:NAD(P)-dependent dehydrogenase (short-subunit alcohol dehydrogenase family)